MEGVPPFSRNQNALRIVSLYLKSRVHQSRSYYAKTQAKIAGKNVVQGVKALGRKNYAKDGESNYRSAGKPAPFLRGHDR
jgi:hypothetical protein